MSTWWSGLSRAAKFVVGFAVGLVVLGLCLGLFLGFSALQQRSAPAAPPPVVDDGTSNSVAPNCVKDRSTYEIPSGDTVTVEAGCRVSGDVVVNGLRLYDNGGDTGLLVDVVGSVKVEAPYGASVTPKGVDEWVADMKASGCEGGCETVNVFTCGPDGCEHVGWK